MSNNMRMETLPEWLVTALSGVPNHKRLRTLEEQIATCHEIRSRSHSRIRSFALGASAEGRTIELLSIGSGAKSVLVVGGPHPNEPIGGLTVEFLLSLMASDPALQERLDCSWHFIIAADPDGLVRNRGWLVENPTLDRYLDHYFRPALIDQPEYTFPLDAEEVRFRSSTPENLAWQRALEICRPHLQVSLHGAEFGGAFFLLSRPVANLVQGLQSLPAACGVPMSRIGEPLLETTPLAEGVFQLPDIATIVSQSRSANSTGAGWPAGQSSAGFATRFGTFSLVPEVPIWDAAELHDTTAGGDSMAAILEAHVERAERLVDVLDSRTESERSAMAEIDALPARSVDEACVLLPTQIATIRALLESRRDALSDPLQRGASVGLDSLLRVFLLRTMSALRSLASRTRSHLGSDSECTVTLQNTDRLLAEGLSELTKMVHLRPVPLKSVVSVQAGAALMAAALTCCDFPSAAAPK